MACEERREKKVGVEWKGVKVQMSEKPSSCLTQQRRPYFILCAVNQLEASERTGTEGAGERGKTARRGTNWGGWAGGGSRLVGRHGAIEPGFTVRRTDVDTDTGGVWLPFSCLPLWYTQKVCTSQTQGLHIGKLIVRSTERKGTLGAFTLNWNRK